MKVPYLLKTCLLYTSGYHGNYHTNKRNHDLKTGVKEDGYVLVAGGCGPMGLGMISYGIQLEDHPKKIVVTDIDDAKLARAEEVISVEPVSYTHLDVHKRQGVPDILEHTENGQRIAVDAKVGKVITNLTVDQEKQYQVMRDEYLKKISDMKQYLPIRPETVDGTKIEVCLNVGSAEKSELELEEYTDGVGLFRTEFL